MGMGVDTTLDGDDSEFGIKSSEVDWVAGDYRIPPGLRPYDYVRIHDVRRTRSGREALQQPGHVRRPAGPPRFYQTGSFAKGGPV